MLEINKIHHGDCLQLMPQIPSSSINMILADLPYGQTQNSWDTIIDLPELWAQYDFLRLPNTAIVLFGAGMFTARMMLFKEKMWRYNYIWEKDRPSNFLNSGHMPMPCHEDVMVFYEEKPTFNPQKFTGKPSHSKGAMMKNTNNNYGLYEAVDNSSPDDTDKLPRDVLYFNRPHPPIHPTEKPVNLYRWLIRTYTNEGDIILDNTSGSGTIAPAALMEKRNFYAIEKKKQYYTESCKRLENFLATPEFDFDQRINNF